MSSNAQLAPPASARLGSFRNPHAWRNAARIPISRSDPFPLIKTSFRKKLSAPPNWGRTLFNYLKNQLDEFVSTRRGSFRKRTVYRPDNRVASFFRASMLLLCSFPSQAQTPPPADVPASAHAPMHHATPSGQQPADPSAQAHSGQMPHEMDHMNHGQMEGMNMGDALNPAETLLMNEASGTSMNPQAAPMPMLMKNWGGWNNMFMGTAFLNDTQQSGPRGADKLYSPNWFMYMLEHKAGGGAFLFETMLSLEPLTVTDRRYPLLFQTGETAYGQPIVDGQHPHNFVMSLGVHYAHSLGEGTIFEFFVAPVGDPALGPVAFPHRDSAREFPQAPIGHHWQDSTHIAYDVVTTGIRHRWLRLEASGFHGAEPGENRWNIGYGSIDSWSTRFSVFPTPNWSAQVSVGHLTHPEALEPGDVVRVTASAEYSRPLKTGVWSSSLIWGQNHKLVPKTYTNSFLVETALPFSKYNTFSGRMEFVQKDELFDNNPALHDQLAKAAGTSFLIQAYTAGYTRYFPLIHWLTTGIGANFTWYVIPDAIKPYYGDHPFGVNMFLRVQLKGGS
jgi:hypothetical protein